MGFTPIKKEEEEKKTGVGRFTPVGVSMSQAGEPRGRFTPLETRETTPVSSAPATPEFWELPFEERQAFFEEQHANIAATSPEVLEDIIKGSTEEPWVDPILAGAGGFGAGAVIGKTLKSAARAGAMALAAEPVVGTAQDYIDTAMTEAGVPGAVKLPINLLTGMTTGVGTEALLRRGTGVGRATRKASKAVRQETKSKFLKELFEEQFNIKAPSKADPQKARQILKQFGVGRQPTTTETLRRLAEDVPTGIKPAPSAKVTLSTGWKDFTNNFVKYVGSPIWDKGVGEKIPQLLEKIPGGKAVNRALIYGHRGDLPGASRFNTAQENMSTAQNLGTDYAVDIGNRLMRVSEVDQIKLGEFVRGEFPHHLPEHLRGLGDETKKALYVLGKQMVDVDLLDEEIFFREAGRYLPLLYNKFEHKSLLKKYSLTKPNRLGLDRIKRRKGLSKKLREAYGEILTPGYPVAKGISQLTHDIETSKFLTGISNNPDWAVVKGADRAIPDGWVKLDESKRLGKLSEAYVHPEIAREMKYIKHVATQGEKVWLKSLGMWKFGKVIISPKTHFRNMGSNSVLAHIGGMPIPMQPVYLKRAAEEMRNGGEYWKAAKRAGLIDSTFAERDLRPMFDIVNSQMKGTPSNSLEESVGWVGKAVVAMRGAGNKAAQLYQAEEVWFKVAKTIHNVERKGMSIDDALVDAEKWLFNYGKLTRFQDAYRKKWYGAPFATFTFKAIPRVLEAAVKTPWRFALPLAMIKGLETASMKKFDDTPEQLKAKKQLRPDWQQGSTLGMSNFARVPVTDDAGREHYLNLTYNLPWGDIGEGGGFGPIPGSLMPLSQPFTKEAAQQIANHDSFWNEQIIKDADIAGKTGLDRFTTEASARLKHLGTTLAPTPIIDIIKGVQALRGEPDYRGRVRNPATVAADVFLGIKMYPVDYAEQATRQIFEKDPKQGSLARKINSSIKTLVTKKRAVEARGDTDLAENYQNQIEAKISQLIGLASEVGEIGEALRRSKGE